MRGTSFASCSIQKRNASGHVEWHSNREHTPIISPTAEKTGKIRDSKK